MVWNVNHIFDHGPSRKHYYSQPGCGCNLDPRKRYNNAVRHIITTPSITAGGLGHAKQEAGRTDRQIGNAAMVRKRVPGYITRAANKRGNASMMMEMMTMMNDDGNANDDDNAPNLDAAKNFSSRNYKIFDYSSRCFRSSERKSVQHFNDDWYRIRHKKQAARRRALLS